MSVRPHRPMAVLACAVALTSAGLAHADLVAIEADTAASTEGLGNFTGTIDWSFGGGPTGTLTISLTNANDAATGGYITAFVFNTDAIAPAATMLASSNPNFAQISDVNGMPFGMSFLAGASTGGSFQGGGNPNGGIAAGETATFVFSIAASNLGDLSASSFLSGPYAHNFVVRFRGFADGGSDKVPATVSGDPIPGPGALVALAVAGLLPRRRRRDA